MHVKMHLGIGVLLGSNRARTAKASSRESKSEIRMPHSSNTLALVMKLSTELHSVESIADKVFVNCKANLRLFGPFPLPLLSN